MNMNHSTQRSSAVFGRAVSSHMMNYRDMRDVTNEDMDWSDSCLDASNNSAMSPSFHSSFLLPSNHHFSSGKQSESTSPLSLFSSLNISEPHRHSFPSECVDQRHGTITSSQLRLVQPRFYPTAASMSLGKPKQKLALEDVSHGDSETRASQSLAMSQKYQASNPYMKLPTFHRTPSTFLQGLKSKGILDSMHQSEGPSTLADSTENEDEVEPRDEIEPSLTLDGSSKSPGADDVTDGRSLKVTSHAQRHVQLHRSSCLGMCRVTLYTLLSILIVLTAVIFREFYFVTPPVCDINMNATLVRQRLLEKVFGQHLAVDIVTESLDPLLVDGKTKNLLVLSFQGWTGIGKNHVSNVLAQFVLPKNLHRFIVTLHSAQNPTMDIEDWTLSKLGSSCGLHLFVMDEMDKASNVLVSSFKRALYSAKGFLTNQNTKAIFLLLSNTGSAAINSFVVEAHQEGLDRDRITYKSLSDRLEPVLQDTWYSEMVKEKLIDRIVPFLPLERQHVAQCVAAALESRGIYRSRDIISLVLDRLAFFPPSIGVFSTTGCRKVNAELDLVLY